MPTPPPHRSCFRPEDADEGPAEGVCSIVISRTFFSPLSLSLLYPEKAMGCLAARESADVEKHLQVPKFASHNELAVRGSFSIV